jgi:hypothetical protein
LSDYDFQIIMKNGLYERVEEIINKKYNYSWIWPEDIPSIELKLIATIQWKIYLLCFNYNWS